ncbi:MAG: universal stress protein [Halobacteria archaeon]|nr:universal stress protein [Halobacteria archaeon]
MYDDILFPVSFYLLDQNELREHAEAIASEFDADVHLLSLTLQDEGKSDVEEHRQSFESFASSLRESGIDVTTELRNDPVEYEDVAGYLADEADDYDLVVMGHTRVSHRRGGETDTTAHKLLDMSSTPVITVPLGAPRFRDV